MLLAVTVEGVTVVRFSASSVCLRSCMSPVISQA